MSFGKNMTGEYEAGFIHPRQRVDVFGAARSKRKYKSLGESLGQNQLPFKKLNICIITQDFVGPVKNGGIGTAYTYAAKALALAGHNVTVLYSVKSCIDRTLDYWSAYYREHGIDFVPVGDPDVPIQTGPSGDAMRINYHVYEWLKKHDDQFDFVHASEWSANAYLCLLAKDTGLHFRNTRFVIKGSSPTLWNRIGNAEPIADIRSLVLMYMERRSIELADYVICGSQYLLNWMEDHGYNIQFESTYVQPNIFPTDDVNRDENVESVKVSELVFFGRLEPRKGIHFFVDALLQLKVQGFFENVDLPKISFLGKPRPGYDFKTQTNKLEKLLNIKVNLLNDKNQPQALDYLSSEQGRVAVMPSLMDNSPFGIYECLSRSIPFITSTAGGGYELVSENDRALVLFDPTPNSLAQRIKKIITLGCPVAHPSFSFKKNIDDWMQWHLWAEAQKSQKRAEDAIDGRPLVSVCLAHHNRGKLLINALESIQLQTYENIEVIVVDDGSTDSESIEILNKIEKTEYKFPISILRNPNCYLGAVRNAGIKASKGEYLLFMDDDNEAKPDEIESFIEVANYTGSEILTCFSDTFSGDRPHNSKIKPRRITFNGENLALGLVGNPYGDSNCFVKRETAVELEGFTEHYKVGRDDVEFFSRAILSGKKVTLVPQALYWYRINEQRMRNFQYSIFAGLVRVSESFTQNIHPDLANIIRLAQGLMETNSPQSPAKNSKRTPQKHKKVLPVRLYERVLKKPLPVKYIEFGRRTVYRFPFLYKYAKRIYNRL